MIKKLLTLFLLALPLYAQPYISGSGTTGDPYLLYTTTHFDSIRYLGDNKCYKLMADLDFTSWGSFTQLPAISSVGGYFKLDMNDHTISNLTIASAGGTFTTGGGGLISSANSTADSIRIEDGNFYNCSLSLGPTTVVGGGFGILVGSIGTDSYFNRLRFTDCNLFVQADQTASSADGPSGLGILAGRVISGASPIIDWQNIIVDSSVVASAGAHESQVAIGMLCGPLDADSGSIKYVTTRYDSASIDFLSGTNSGYIGGLIGYISASPTGPISIYDSYSLGFILYNEQYGTGAHGGGVFGWLNSPPTINIIRVWSTNALTMANGYGGIFGGDMTNGAGDTYTFTDSYYGDMGVYDSTEIIQANSSIPFDFTDGNWVSVGGAVIDGPHVFHTGGIGGLKILLNTAALAKDRLFVSNYYSFIWGGSSGTTPGLRNSNGTSSNTIIDGFGAKYAYLTASDTYLYIRNPAAATTTVDSIKAYMTWGSKYYPDTTGITHETVAGTVTNRPTHLTNAQLKDTSNYAANYDWSNVWGWSATLNDGFPYLLSSASLILSEPAGGENYIAPDSVNITWMGQDTVVAYYTKDAGTTYTLIDTISGSPYYWNFTSLSINSDQVMIRITNIDSSAYAESGLFTMQSHFINIIYPNDSTGTIAVGDTIPIKIEVVGIDTMSTYYAVDDTLNGWVPIVLNDTILITGKDTITYSWPLPPGIYGNIYIKATETADTNKYDLTRGLTGIGVNLSLDPIVCWTNELNTPVESHWVNDPTCGWGSPPHKLENATIKDKADGYDFTSEYCGPPYDTCTVEYSQGVYLYTALDTTYYTLNQFYDHGDSLTYWYRRYFIRNDTLFVDDLRNGINDIYVANLAAYILPYKWVTVPTSIWIYNVQRSKIQGDTLSVSTIFENLNDADFSPQILLSANRAGGGYYTMAFDALPKPGPLNPVYDVQRIFLADGGGLKITRTYFRGIDPKAHKTIK